MTHRIEGTKAIRDTVEIEISDDRMYDLVISFLHKEFDIPFDYKMEEGKVYRTVEYGGHTSYFRDEEYRDMEVIDPMIQTVLGQLKYNRVEKRRNR